MQTRRMATCVLVIEDLSGGRNIINLPNLYLGIQAKAFVALYQSIIDSLRTTLINSSRITLAGNSERREIPPRFVCVRSLGLKRV